MNVPPFVLEKKTDYFLCFECFNKFESGKMGGCQQLFLPRGMLSVQAQVLCCCSLPSCLTLVESEFLPVALRLSLRRNFTANETDLNKLITNVC